MVRDAGHRDERLSFRLAVDAGSAAFAALAVSPIMTVIDKAVTESAAGHQSIVTSARSSLRTLCFQPGKLILRRPFMAMMLLYFGTFAASNIGDTICARSEGVPADTTSASAAKLSAVIGVNLCLSMYKDGVFARSFGGSLLSQSLPAFSYAAFLIRDSITLFAVFNAPSIIAPMLSESIEQHISRLTVAQLVAPAASQFVVTPLHTLGLDMHNRRAFSLKERLRVVRRVWWTSSAARALRVLPAFGAGSVLNTGMRHLLSQENKSYTLQEAA